MATQCRACGAPIKPAAVLCAKCGSYQDFRYYLGVGQTTLALLIALFSVVGLVSPSLTSLWAGEHSKLKGNFVDFRENRAVFFISNSGTAPGLVIDGRLRFILGKSADGTNETVGFSLAIEADDQTIVVPGTVRTVSITGSGASIELVAQAFANKGSDDCLVILTGREFDGTPFTIETSSLCVGVINTLMAAHRDTIYELAKAGK